MKKLKLGILGVIAFGFISVISGDFNVYAAKCNLTLKAFEAKYKNTCTKKNIANTYRLSMSIDDIDDDILTIEVAGKKAPAGNFKVTNVTSGSIKAYKNAKGDWINITSIDQLPKINKNNNLELKVSTGKDEYITITTEFVSSTDNNFKYCFPSNICAQEYKYTNGTPFTVELGAISGEAIVSSSALSADKINSYISEFLQITQPSETSSSSSDEIGEKITQIKNDRQNTIFADVKTIVPATSQSNAVKEAYNYQKDLYCNANIDKSTLISNTLGDYGDPVNYYNANRVTYYATDTETISSKAKLERNYSPTTYDANQETKDICKKTCEEAVEVEYGAPVASMAGLCFEYNVKVTSYVKCNAEVTYNEGDLRTELTKNYNYCTPNAVCNSTVNYFDQAGPNEEYESCIQNCDGGKYSRKCSNKCYKEIYEFQKNSPINYFAKVDTTDTKLLATRSYKDCADEDGCYYFDGKKIRWQGREGASYNPKNCDNVEDRGNVPGRYYKLWAKQCPTDSPGTSGYYADNNGFMRGIHGDSVCQEKCFWTGCKDNQYLNPSQAEADAETNFENIKSAINSCKAQAKCSENVAYVTIKANYGTTSKLNQSDSDSNTGNNSECVNAFKHNQNFNATVPSNNTSSSSYSDKNNIVINRGACYLDNNNGINDKYLIEWGFPGTYVDLKHGNVSYTTKPSNGYYYKERNFCLPTNIASVNTNWWNNFMKDGKVTGYSDDRKKLDTNIKYNIKATIKNEVNGSSNKIGFGFFNWRFNINCFFAVNNAPTATQSPSDSSDTTGGEKCDPKLTPHNNYSFRVVDKTTKEDLFANRASIGFNWTAKATTQNMPKTNGYNESPEKIAEKIAAGDDNTEDYTFNLNKDTMIYIKQYLSSNKDSSNNNNVSYTAYSGSYQFNSDKSVKYYISPLIKELLGRDNANNKRADKILERNNNFK